METIKEIETENGTILVVMRDGKITHVIANSDKRLPGFPAIAK